MRTRLLVLLCSLGVALAGCSNHVRVTVSSLLDTSTVVTLYLAPLGSEPVFTATLDYSLDEYNDFDMCSGSYQIEIEVYSTYYTPSILYTDIYVNGDLENSLSIVSTPTSAYFTITDPHNMSFVEIVVIVIAVIVGLCMCRCICRICCCRSSSRLNVPVPAHRDYQPSHVVVNKPEYHDDCSYQDSECHFDRRVYNEMRDDSPARDIPPPRYGSIDD